MDPIWLDRDRVEREVKAVDFSELTFDPDCGVYCRLGEPFTGVCSRRFPDGKLQSIVHNAEGVATGVTVAWYPNGQIKLYCEMNSDALHGLHIEWAKDGTKLLEQRYRRGNVVTD